MKLLNKLIVLVLVFSCCYKYGNAQVCPPVIDNTCTGCTFDNENQITGEFWSFEFGTVVSNTNNNPPIYTVSNDSKCDAFNPFDLKEQIRIINCNPFNEYVRKDHDPYRLVNLTTAGDINVGNSLNGSCAHYGNTFVLGNYEPLVDLPNVGNSIDYVTDISSRYEILTKSFTKTNQLQSITFDYAYVGSDYNRNIGTQHGGNLNRIPQFWVEVIVNGVDATQYPILPSNGPVGSRVDLGSAEIANVEHPSIITPPNSNRMFYIPWRSAHIDLRGIQANATVEIRFINRAEVRDEIMEDCFTYYDFGYTYLDNIQNNSCSLASIGTGVYAAGPGTYNGCSCEANVCVDYDYDAILNYYGLTECVDCDVEMKVDLYHDNSFLWALDPIIATTGTNQHCFNLLNTNAPFVNTMEGFDYVIRTSIKDNTTGFIVNGPIYIGAPNTGQDNLTNNDIEFNQCAVPVLNLLGNRELCAGEEPNPGDHALFNLDYNPQFISNYTLEVNTNDGTWLEIPNYLNNLDANGGFSYEVNYVVLDCDIDCISEYLKHSKYGFRIKYTTPNCLPGSELLDNYTEPIYVNVYPPLREDHYYSIDERPNCARPNIPISTVKPCYNGTNGEININVDCIIGGIQNQSTRTEEICTKTKYSIGFDLINQTNYVTASATILELPFDLELLTNNNETTVTIGVHEIRMFNVDDEETLSLSANTYPISSNGSFTMPLHTLNTSTNNLIINISYHIVLLNGEIFDISIPAYQTLITGGLISPDPVVICEDYTKELFTGEYNFVLYRDAVFDNQWSPECREYIGEFNNISDGIVAFNDNTIMHQADYLLTITSVLGCTEEPIDTLIYLEQLDRVDTGFEEEVYYWCPDQPIDITVKNFLSSEYTYTWDRPGDGVLSADYSTKTLFPYTCAGGIHTLKIERLAGINDGSQTCFIEHETFVVDFNPPPLVLDQYEDAIGIGAGKFKSTWLNSFIDIQKNDPQVIQEIRDRNPYATGQAGIFRAYQSFDYLDNNRRQFLDRAGSEVNNPILIGEDETIIQTDGVIGLPEPYTHPTTGITNTKTLTKGFAWNNPMLADCAPEWTFNSEITEYNSYNFETENKDILDRYSTALYGFGGKLTTAVAANADYHEVAFESFEEYAAIPSSDFGQEENEATELPHFFTSSSGEALTIFSNDGVGTFTITIDNNKFGLKPGFIPDGNNVLPKVALYLKSPSSNSIGTEIWSQSIDHLADIPENIAPFSRLVNEGYELKVVFQSHFSEFYEVDKGFITVDYAVQLPATVHQFSNTPGNFDFVTESKVGPREYLIPYNVISGFGNYAIIDLPYSSVCESADPADPASDKMLVKYAAQSLEFECREKNNITEVVGDKTIVTLLPDPCAIDPLTGNTMVYFSDKTAPGFYSENNVQYWNGTIYKVISKESATNVDNLARGVLFTEEAAHTGKVSMKIDAASPQNNQKVSFTHPDLILHPNKEYLLSAWIRAVDANEISGFDDVSPFTLKETNLQNQIGCYITIGDLPDQFFAPAGDVIEGWQRLEAKVKVPENGGEVKISFNPLLTMYVDDIRIHPARGGMQTYVYDLQRFRLQATLDHNNYATLYSYDDEGNLFHVAKETMGGIKTIQVSSAYIKPNNN